MPQKSTATSCRRGVARPTVHLDCSLGCTTSYLARIRLRVNQTCLDIPGFITRVTLTAPGVQILDVPCKSEESILNAIISLGTRLHELDAKFIRQGKTCRPIQIFTSKHNQLRDLPCSSVTAFLSVQSDLLPTSILFTPSEACCSTLECHVRMSIQCESQQKEAVPDSMETKAEIGRCGFTKRE
jgi:hypothetical protein